MKTDRQLAAEVPWHDKRELCRILGQPYYEIPAGKWCIKPAVSVEGLGYGARQLDTGCPLVIQPWAEGQYLCIDSRQDGEHREHAVFTAERDSWRFLWFARAPGAHVDIWRDLQIASLMLDAPAEINTEWLGRYCIEAHARPSAELRPLRDTDATHAVPLWDDETRGRLERAQGVDFVFVKDIDPETEVAVDGYWRRGIAYVRTTDECLRAALGEPVHPV